MGPRWGFLLGGVGCAIVVACSSFGADGVDSTADAGSDAMTNMDGPVPESSTLDAGNGCPDPSMTKWIASGTAYCVDRLEVTEAEYYDFQTNTPPATLQQLANDDRYPEGCRPGPTPALGGSLVGGSSSRLPVVDVGFCPAALYCISKSKRMCGSITGKGAPVTGGVANIMQHELVAACSNNGVWPNSVPPEQDSGCWLEHRPDAGPRATGDEPACGHDGILDLIGNVAEWVNEKNDATQPDGAPGATYTRAIGGDWQGSRGSTTCTTDFGADGPSQRYSNGHRNIGFRCCASL